MESQEAVPIELPKYTLTKLNPSYFETSSPIVTTPVDYDSNNWIYLTLDGENIFTWNNEDNYTYLLFKNNVRDESGWIINPELGYVVISEEFDENDTFELRLYKSYYDGGHRLETFAWIYPWSILGSEIFSLPRMQGEKFPGFIHGWFEKIHEIESLLNFLGEYENGTIASHIEILENIESNIELKDI